MPARPKTTTAFMIRIAAASLSLAAATSGLVLSAGTGAAAAEPTSAQCQSVTALTNGGFEDPAIGNSSYQIRPTSSVPGWESTDPAGIELWSSGFSGVPAAAGRQFAELNATQAGTLYQEVATMPGQSLQWSLLHRGRAGTDVMDVLIGSPSGTLVSQGALSDGTGAWGRHTGVYVVPSGQTVTRFGFRAVSTGSGNASIGNFLDDISFGTGPCVVLGTTTANVSNPGGPARVGDVLEYSVSAQNRGGSPATVSSLRAAVPAGTSFLPGSLVTGGVAQSDAPGDDAAEISARAIIGRIGSGSTASTGGSVAAGETATIVYRVVVTSAAALGDLTSDAALTFSDPYTGLTSNQAAPVVVTPVGAAADLVVGQTVDTAAPVAGSTTPIRFTSTITNAGPQATSAVVATVTPPPALVDPVVTLGGVPCVVAGGVALCSLGDLPNGDAASIVVEGRVGASTPAGSLLASTVSVTGSVFDPDAANSTSTTVATTATAGDLWVKPAPRSVVREGDTAVFAFTVGNAGPSDAVDVVVDLVLPTGFTLASDAGTVDAGTWSLGALESGASRTVRAVGPTTALGGMTAWAGIRSSSVTDTTTVNDEGVAGVSVEAVPLLVPPSVDAPTASPTAAAPAYAPAAASPAAAPQPSAVALAMTGASEANGAALLAAIMLITGTLIVVLRRRTPGHHRA